nr:hypothetical protein [Tanacetum cinerariifolium]
MNSSGVMVVDGGMLLFLMVSPEVSGVDGDNVVRVSFTCGGIGLTDGGGDGRRWQPCCGLRIPLLYQGEYSQWVERFMNYIEEQTDREAMINSIKNGDQPLPCVTQVSIAGTTSTEQPPLKDKSM